jgi:hypothetical protein
MNFKDILVISGQGGLYKYISQNRNTVIVENLTDCKRSSISSTAKISMLEDIAVFTENADMPLREVLRKIQAKENGGTTVPHKSPDQVIKDYFSGVLPEYDRQRVYLSDIRKILMWYNLLHDIGINDFEEPGQSGEEQPELPAATDSN